MSQILDTRFQIAFTSEHVPNFRWIPVQRARRLDGNKERRKKKERKKEESMVKYTSADIYVGRLNN